MPINFFNSRCKTESNNVRFGLCDDPPPAENPAYINEDDPTKWIGIVKNLKRKVIEFYAIDHCIIILKPDGKSESRCDGMLRYDNSLIFIELKARGSSGWLSKARNQLTITIGKFTVDNPLTNFDKVDAFACNSLRPHANTSHNTEIQNFKDDTGLILKVQQEIII